MRDTTVLGKRGAAQQLPGAAPPLLRASDPHTHRNGDNGIPEPYLRKGSPPLGHTSYTWEEVTSSTDLQKDGGKIERSKKLVFQGKREK